MNPRAAAAMRDRAQLRGGALAWLFVALGCSSPPGSAVAGGAGSSGVGAIAGFSAAGGKGSVAQGGASSGKLFDGVAVNSPRAAALVGGSLLVTRDGATAVAADPDRDAVFLVRMHDLSVTRLDVGVGAVPGRVLEGPAGRVFALAAGTGKLIAIDVEGRSVVYESALCDAPRGLDFDDKTSRVYVACRSGRLLTLDANSGELLASQRFDDDLNDVLVKDDTLVLTRRRSAELLVVRTSDGSVLRRGKPDSTQARSNGTFRALRLPSGEIVMSHAQGVGLFQTAFPGQSSCFARATAPVLSVTSGDAPPMPDPQLPPSPSRDPVDTPASALELSFVEHVFAGSVGPLDLAISPAGDKFAVLALGESWLPNGPPNGLFVAPIDRQSGSVSQAFWGVSDSCASTLGKGTSLEPIAVAFDQAGGVILQSREPSALVLDNGVRVPLGEESRRDTGLALFYMDVGTGYSCASCHPGGADDGLVWQAFAVAAPRRTPSLEGHGARRGPYFWAGDMDTFQHLAEFLLVDRLGLAPAPSPQQIDSLQAWLMTLPAPALDPDLDAQSVERGRARFAALACDSCHAGDEWSDYALHDVGTGGTFRTPSLIGVALRAPYFHDGCASSLSGVFGACGGGPAHEVGVDVDLVEFLRSL